MNKLLHVYKTKFSEHNRYFISQELQHDKFPFKVKRIVMLNCGGTRDNKPMYNEYYIDIIDYTDGSHNTCITSGKLSFNLDYDGELIKYYEKNYKELDKSFKDTFVMMYNNVEAIKTLENTIYLISDNIK